MAGIKRLIEQAKREREFHRSRGKNGQIETLASTLGSGRWKTRSPAWRQSMAEKMTGWQDIASAPKDGSAVLVFEDIGVGEPWIDVGRCSCLTRPPMTGEKLNARDLDFMRRLETRQRLAPADREEDRMRQRLRKAGLVEVLMKPRRWSLTSAGWRALDEAEERPLRLIPRPDEEEPRP